MSPSPMPIISLSDAEALIENANPEVFKIGTTTTPSDKRALLAFQNVIRNRNNSYNYVEIGSDLGGTLVPHLLDTRCSSVSSIDLRPAQQPDERGVTFDYTHSSTALMMAGLQSQLPFSSLLKLVTYECDASALPQEALKTPFELGFIDGEHTNKAVFQDFLSLWRFAADDCIISFHDANLVTDGLSNVESFLAYQGVEFESIVLPDVVFAVFVGRYARLARPLMRYALNKETFFHSSKEAVWDSVAVARRVADQ